MTRTRLILAALIKHGKPLMASEGGSTPAKVEGDGHAITDEGVGEPDVHP